MNFDIAEFIAQLVHSRRLAHGSEDEQEAQAQESHHQVAPPLHQEQYSAVEDRIPRTLYLEPYSGAENPTPCISGAGSPGADTRITSLLCSVGSARGNSLAKLVIVVVG